MSADHDPLCRPAPQTTTYTVNGPTADNCEACRIVREARADERRQARQRVEALPLLPYRGEWAIKYAEAAAAAGGDA